MPREKIKFALRMSPETQPLVKDMCPRDNCQTQNEFIEKAIRFYAGYISGQDACCFLPAALTDALRSTVHDSENRVCRLLFKLAVELDMVMNVLAAGMEIPQSDLDHLRGRCVRDAGMVLPVCRLSVKMPNVMVTGATNSNGMPPTITIGCGTWGGNSGSDNLNYTHLLNKTRIIRRIENAVDKAIDDIFKD